MSKPPEKDQLPEYDFSNGTRGKYVARVAKGGNVVVQAAWDKEIKRRIAAHGRGEVKAYDLEEVMDEARRPAP